MRTAAPCRPRTAAGRMATSSAPASSCACRRCRPNDVSSDEVSPMKTASVPLPRSEEHTSELQSLMRISYAVFCLKKKKKRFIATYQKTIPACIRSLSENTQKHKKQKQKTKQTDAHKYNTSKLTNQ